MIKTLGLQGSEVTLIIGLTGDGGCGFIAAYGSSPSAWSKGRQPSGAVLHSSRETGELWQ